MENDLNKKRVLLIGGSSGIGLAVAKSVCQCGAYVTIASRKAEKCKAEFSELPQNRVETYDFDITSPKEHRQLFESTGPIDHLILAVRPEIHSAPFLSVDVENAKQAFETKLWGVYRLIQAGQGNIRETGSIILTSGIAGEKIYNGASVMSLINSATETLCRILAVELAPIRVNAVSPGFVEPKPKEIRKLAENFPAKRLANMEEVVSAYRWLMGNRYVSGTIVKVDGGAVLM